MASRAKKIAILIIGYTLPAAAIQQQPWLYSPFQMVSQTSYSYQYFSSVDNAVNPCHYSSSNNFIYLDFLGAVWPTWDIQIALDFDETSRLSFGVLDVGLQGRYGLLNEFMGDPISLAIWLQGRFVPQDRLTDVVTPYHAIANFELGCSVGKECNYMYTWIWRNYGLCAIGMAERGYPWFRLAYNIEAKFLTRDSLEAFIDGYFGTGPEICVDVCCFDGYASIAHRSIDMGLRYHHYFPVWGAFDISYAIRVYAKSYPSGASTALIRYTLPFSL